VTERPISRSPLKPIFVTPALRSAASRSPLRSRSPDFPLPRSAHMLFLRKVSRATDSISIGLTTRKQTVIFVFII